MNGLIIVKYCYRLQLLLQRFREDGEYYRCRDAEKKVNIISQDWWVFVTNAVDETDKSCPYSLMMTKTAPLISCWSTPKLIRQIMIQRGSFRRTRPETTAKRDVKSEV